MTRTARRKNKKEPLSATPWEELKVDAVQQPGSREQSNKLQKLKTVKKGILKVTREKKLRPHLSERLTKKLRKTTGRQLKRSLSDTIPLLKSSELNDSEGDQAIDSEPLERQKVREKKASALGSRKRKVKRRLSEDRVPLLHPESESSLSDEPGSGWAGGGESVDLGGCTLAESDGDRKKILKVKSTKRRKVSEKESGYREHRVKGREGNVVGVTNGGNYGVDPSHQGEVNERRRRRIEQQKLRRQRSKVCFNCRQPGHWVGECPLNPSSTGICFKCGSAEHSCQQCKAKVTAGEFPYAKCFICNEMGHLSRSCPDNPRGLYPKGGGCKICGSVEHLKANCPQKEKSSNKGTAYSGGHSTSTATSADAEVFAEEGTGVPKKKKHKQMKEKVVKF